MNYQPMSRLVLAICILFSGIHSQAQAPINEPDLHKPRLFDNLPAEIPVSTVELKGLLAQNAVAGKEVSVKFADAKRSAFAGQIVSAASKYGDKLHSVVVRSTNFKGAMMTISAITLEDGSVAYKGRIISFQHADLYELEKKNDQYILVKKNYYELVNE